MPPMVRDETGQAFGWVFQNPRVSGHLLQAVTLTLKQHWLELPEEFTAVQQTVVFPIGKELPEGGWQLTVAGHEEVTAGEGQETMAPHRPGSDGCTILDEQVTVGGGQQEMVAEHSLWTVIEVLLLVPLHSGTLLVP